MKYKVFIFLLISFIIVSAFAIFASENPGLYYDFYYEWDESWLSVPATLTGTSCTLEYSNNSLRVDMEDGDPNFSLEVREVIDLSEYPFIKVRLKNESTTSGMFEMYLSRDGESLGEANNFKYEIGKGHTEFKDVIINAKKLKGNWWTGELTGIRLDCLNNPSKDGGDVFYLEYIAFFKTEEDALAYAPDRSITPAPTSVPTPEPTATPKATEPIKTNSPKPVATQAADEKVDWTSPKLSPIAIIISIAIAIAAIAVAVILIVRARKKH